MITFHLCAFPVKFILQYVHIFKGKQTRQTTYNEDGDGKLRDASFLMADCGAMPFPQQQTWLARPKAGKPIHKRQAAQPARSRGWLGLREAVQCTSMVERFAGGPAAAWAWMDWASLQEAERVDWMSPAAHGILGGGQYQRLRLARPTLLCHQDNGLLWLG